MRERPSAPPRAPVPRGLPSHAPRFGLTLLSRLTALALAGLVLGLALPGAAAASEPPVVAVGHDPFSPAPGESYNVSLTLEANFSVEWIKLFVCTVTEGWCAFPQSADPVAGRNHTYGNASPIETLEGHVQGYRFVVEDTNGTQYKYPLATTTYPGLELVQLLDSYYFKVQVQGNLSEVPADDEPAGRDIPAPGFAGLLAALVTATYMAARRVS